VRSQAVTDAIIANGNVIDQTVTSTSISTFVNGADSRTKGVDLVVNYDLPLPGSATLDLTLMGNYGRTRLTKLAAPSPQIAASGQRYLDLIAISYLETAAPDYKLSLDNVFRKDGWAIDLRGTLYGPSSAWIDGGGTSNFVRNVVDEALIVDLDIHYAITSAIGISIGANNLFNVYPTKVDPITYAAGLAASGNGVATTNNWAPFGINGGYYYSNLTIKF
jgi:iron complex outermembrane receptor protein